MTGDTHATIILCSRLGTDNHMKPFTAKEWGNILRRLGGEGLTPESILGYDHDALLKFFDDDTALTTRAEVLIRRSGSIVFEIEKLASRGIRIASQTDPEYPMQLKHVLANKAPSLFFYAGDTTLTNKPECNGIGIVGSRNVGSQEYTFINTIVRTFSALGFGTISGGARGVDMAASQVAEACGMYAIEFISDSLEDRLKNPDTLRRICDGTLLIYSAALPNAKFDVGMAMGRNKYIYAASKGTVVIKSDLGKGGTWNGASENLRNKWCPLFCWDNPAYAGNQELIRLGATGIREDWDAHLPAEANNRENTREDIPSDESHLPMFGKQTSFLPPK